MRYPVRTVDDLIAECRALRDAPPSWHSERCTLDAGARELEQRRAYWGTVLDLIAGGRLALAAQKLRPYHNDLARVAESIALENDE